MPTSRDRKQEKSDFLINGKLFFLDLFLYRRAHIAQCLANEGNTRAQYSGKRLIMISSLMAFQHKANNDNNCDKNSNPDLKISQFTFIHLDFPAP